MQEIVICFYSNILQLCDFAPWRELFFLDGHWSLFEPDQARMLFVPLNSGYCVLNYWRLTIQKDAVWPGSHGIASQSGG